MACTSLVSLGASLSTLLGSKVTFQPLGAVPDSVMSSATASPELVSTIAMADSTPAVALAESTPSRPDRSILGWPLTSRPRSVVTLASSATTRAVTLYLPAATVLGGVTFSLTSLDWPASMGTALNSWLPYCSV